MRLPHIPIRLPKNRFLRYGVLPVTGIVIVAVVVFVVVYELNRPGNVYHPNVAFTAPPTTTTETTPAPPRKPKVNTFSWPVYGYSLSRTRDFTAAPNDLHPPFKVAWSHGGNALLEFSPSIYGNDIYYMDDGATVKKLDIRNGRQKWAHHLGTLSAATPALDPKGNLLFVPTLSTHGHYPGDGRFVALNMSNGHIRWKIPLPSGSESSPAYNDGVVYFGTQAGTVYAVNAKNGHVKWKFQAAGAVKGGPAISNGLVYFGDYAGKVYAVHVGSGRLDWEAGSGSGAFGFGSGTFYATPAVAYGRVYIGNTNGFMYSFGAHTGDLAWTRGTGAYVYAGAAVADVSGLGPTVFIGSYNGDFYALNAKNGGIDWVHDDGYRISGASTVVGNVIYYSDFNRRTTGLNVRTGKQVFTFPDGAYTPVIADDSKLYLDGDYVLYALEPRGAHDPKPAHKVKRRKASAKSAKKRRSTKKHRRTRKR